MNAEVAILAELHQLRLSTPEVTGAVFAGTDGMQILSDSPSLDPDQLAAISAASYGLSRRLTQTLGQGPLRESAIRAVGGIVYIYPAGEWALLTVVANPAVEVTRLHADASLVAHRVGVLWDSLRQPSVPARTGAIGGPAAVPFDPYAPLAVRTPMATLRADHRG